MIYEAVDLTAPIRQGDIFRDIPRIDISLTTLPVVESDGTTSVTSWNEFLSNHQDETALAVVLPVARVDAIVISQDCDASRGEYISLCQIEALTNVNKTPPTTAHKWQKLLTEYSRNSLRFFYLHSDPVLGFAERRFVDFRTVLPVKRVDLEHLCGARRIARLNSVAFEHFRETLAQFFRRYPVNEWYPLTREEFAAYASGSDEPIEPYPWQAGSA